MNLERLKIQFPDNDETEQQKVLNLITAHCDTYDEDVERVISIIVHYSDGTSTSVENALQWFAEYHVATYEKAEEFMLVLDRIIRNFSLLLANRSNGEFIFDGVNNHLVLRRGQNIKHVREGLKKNGIYLEDNMREQFLQMCNGICKFLQRERGKLGLLSVNAIDSSKSPEQEQYHFFVTRFAERLKSLSFLEDVESGQNFGVSATGPIVIPGISKEKSHSHLEIFTIKDIAHDEEIYQTLPVYYGGDRESRRYSYYTIPTPIDIHLHYQSYMMRFFDIIIKNPQDITSFRKKVETEFREDWEKSGCGPLLQTLQEIVEISYYPVKNRYNYDPKNLENVDETREADELLRQYKITSSIRRNVIDNPSLQAHIKVDVISVLASMGDKYADMLMEKVANEFQQNAVAIQEFVKKIKGKDKDFDLHLLASQLMLILTATARRIEVFNSDSIKESMGMLDTAINTLKATGSQNVFKDFIQNGERITSKTPEHWENNSNDYKKLMTTVSKALPNLVMNILSQVSNKTDMVTDTRSYMPNEPGMLYENLEPMGRLLNAEFGLLSLTRIQNRIEELFADPSTNQALSEHLQACFNLLMSHATLNNAYLIKSSVQSTWPLLENVILPNAEQETGRSLERVPDTHAYYFDRLRFYKRGILQYLVGTRVLRAFQRDVLGVDFKLSERQTIHIDGGRKRPGRN